MSNAFELPVGMADFEVFTGGPAHTNGYLLPMGWGWVLVDAPQGVAAWLRGQGRKVDVLLLTHQHFDHVWDAAEVAAEHGCEVWAFSAYDVGLTLETLYAQAAGPAFRITPFKVSKVLGGCLSVELLGESIQTLPVPGHSPDSLCYHWAAAGCLFGGDVLFAGSIGRADLPGGSMNQLLEGIDRQLRPLSPQTLVLPGHGPSTTLGREWSSNPFLGSLAQE